MQKSSLSAKRNFRSFSLWFCHWKKHFRFAFARFCVAKLINFRFLSEHSFCVLSWALTVLSTAYNVGTCDKHHNWQITTTWIAWALLQGHALPYLKLVHFRPVQLARTTQSVYFSFTESDCNRSMFHCLILVFYNIATQDVEDFGYRSWNKNLKISEQNVWVTFLRCCRSRVYFVQLFRYISLSLLSRIRLAFTRKK